MSVSLPCPNHTPHTRAGVGKSTLLRSMVCRELCLPAGVSVLHVEQEVTGDNTLALDSVLECDTERV